MEMGSTEILKEAFRVLEIEAQAVLDLKETLGEEFLEAVQKIKDCSGKVIVSGIGKSGQIGRKISSTLSSTGTPSFYLHPSESSHGDLGVVGTDDILVVISYGGGSPEINDLVGYVVRKGIPIIAMTGNSDSKLAKAADIVLNIGVKKEACPMGLAPTASSTVTLALGDALAMAVLKLRGFREQDFAQLHPGGSLGRRLLTRVKDLMHTGVAVPLVDPTTPLIEVISRMTDGEVRGTAGVVNSTGSLIGIITDGDVRRHLAKSSNPLGDLAQDLMSTNPKTILAEELAEKALLLMENFRIQSLFVITDQEKEIHKPVGVLHLQDLLNAKIR